jgi:hypothetical protein
MFQFTTISASVADGVASPDLEISGDPTAARHLVISVRSRVSDGSNHRIASDV